MLQISNLQISQNAEISLKGKRSETSKHAGKCN